MVARCGRWGGKFYAPRARGCWPFGLDKTIFDNLISARQFDIDRRAFDGLPEASGYLSATSGGLMLIAGQSLGAKDGDFAVLRAGGLALGVLNLLRAAPALQSVGAGAFDLDDSNFIISLVKLGLENLAIARAGRVGLPPDVRPVLFPLWQAQDLLTRVALAPHLVAEGKLSQSPAKRSFGLLKAGFFGIW
jgi:phytoene synthase